jgi:hypothetical protein
VTKFSDVNAFLTFAATRHTLLPEELREKPRVDEIVAAAKAGRIPVYLVSSEFLVVLDRIRELTPHVFKIYQRRIHLKPFLTMRAFYPFWLYSPKEPTEACNSNFYESVLTNLL